jgi:hypothetical protein
MRRVLCSYAYDVPHYYDFVVEVPDDLDDKQAEAFAEQRAEIALAEELFADKAGSPSYENIDNERVFVSGPATAMIDGDSEPVLESLAVPVEVKEPATNGRGKRHGKTRTITLHIKEAK